MKKILVTQPSLAPLDEYVALLKGVWDRGILTHNGPLVQRFEQEMKDKFHFPNFLTVTNGTIALQVALKALDLPKGEIIVPSFTWVASISAIQWEGFTPVFADIDPQTLNIDLNSIRDKINERTVAIMPVHVFGVPCDVEGIHQIADEYNLKVVYDGAHAIGSTFKNKPLLEYGDISATSLHATKLLNTAEGGACVTRSDELQRRMEEIRFFGHNQEKEIVTEGFNGKMTEVHAALGIVNLVQFDEVFRDRKVKYVYYKESLSSIRELEFQHCKYGESNYSYFPVIFESESLTLEILSALSKKNIYPRRYFYPSVNTLSGIVKYSSTPISEDISSRILCLPLYYSLSYNEIDEVIDTVRSVVGMWRIGKI